MRDDVGADFADLAAAKSAAVASLPDITRDKLPDGDARTFMAMVRSTEGQILLQAGLTTKVEQIA